MHVIYIAPILKQYLHELSEIFHKEVTKMQRVMIDHKYLPYVYPQL